MYADSVIYVEMPDEYPYYRTYDGIEWERSDKLDEYLDSYLMLSYLKTLRPHEAIAILTLKRKEKEGHSATDSKRSQNGGCSNV